MLPPQIEAAQKRHVVVRQPLPVTPERAFLLFTRGSELERWFCHTVSCDERVGGVVEATWLDEDGEPWQRLGQWAAFEPPNLAVLQWASSDPDVAGETLRVAIAPAEQGCVVTVISPLLTTETHFSADVMIEAVTIGWNTTFAELAVLLQKEG